MAAFDLFSTLKDAAGNAVKMEVGMGASRALLYGTKKALGDKVPALTNFLESQMGEKVAMVLLPGALHGIACSLDGKLPYASSLKSLCEQAMIGSTSQATAEVIDYLKPRLGEIIGELTAGEGGETFKKQLAAVVK